MNRKKYFDTIENALTIRIGENDCMYDLNGNDFEIDLQAEAFRLVSLRKENKNIYVELEGEHSVNCKQQLTTSVAKRIDVSPDDLNCPGASPSHLAIGSTAYISVHQASVHQFPNEFPPLVENKYLKRNRVVTIIDGPVCGEGNPGHALFWKVRSQEITFSNGKRGVIVGWVAEESGDEYLLRPK